MRIISGVHKGRKLIAPKNLSARPTTDVAKEGLFNILNHRFDLSSLKVLDLFSGTGNISYEFYSRGCHNITAVEQDRTACAFIKKIADQLAMDQLTVRCTKVESFLQSPSTAFDIVFLDPPYAIGLAGYSKLIAQLFDYQWISEEGVVIAEHFTKDDLSELNHFAEVKTYGSSSFSFFQKKSRS